MNNINRKIKEYVERFLLAELFEMHRIPSKEEILRSVSVTESQLEEIDSKYRLLNSLWNFSDSHQKVFFTQLISKGAKVENLESLLDLIAQTELKVAGQRLRKMSKDGLDDK